MGTSASPLLHDMMFSTDQQVRDPYRDETVYDRRKLEYKDKNYKDTPRINRLGAGSDYYAFYKFLGIPSIDMIYGQTNLVSWLLFSFGMSVWRLIKIKIKRTLRKTCRRL